MNAVTDPITQTRRQEQSLPVMKERIPDLSLPMVKHEKAAGSRDEEQEVGPPAPSSKCPRGWKRREPKKKNRVDEVGGEWKKEDNTPIDIP